MDRVPEVWRLQALWSPTESERTSTWHQRSHCSEPSEVKIQPSRAGGFLLRVQLLPPLTFISPRIDRLRVSPVPLCVEMVWKLRAFVCLLLSVRPGSAGRWRRGDGQQPPPGSLLPAAGAAAQEGAATSVTNHANLNIMAPLSTCPCIFCERSLRWSHRWSCACACVCVCLCSAEPVLSLVHRDYWQCFEQLTHQDACGRYTCFPDVLAVFKRHRLK